MSNNGTDGSEDGQIVTPPNSTELDFSLSEEEDVDCDSSLNIKPPQLTASRDERVQKLRERERIRHHESRVRSREKRRHRHEKHVVRLKHGERRYREDPLKDRVPVEKEKQSHSHERHRIKPSYDKNNADRVLQDLRSRLLNKRNKHQVNQDMDRKEEEEKGQGGSREKFKKEGMANRDVETEARRDRLLEAEREMARLKRSSRAELEARREMRREARNIFAHSDNSPGDQKSPDMARKRLRNSSRDSSDRGSVEMNVVTVSDDTEDEKDDRNEEEEEGEEEEEEEGSVIDSDSSTNESEYSVENASSPLSVGELAKSDRNSDREKSASRSRSVSPEENAKVPSSVVPITQKSPSPGAFPDDGVEVHQVQQGCDKNNVSEPFKEFANFPPYFPGIQGCRSVAEFQCLNRIEEGTYGVVYRAKDLRTEEIVALKRLKMEKEKEGFPITSLREINTLLKAQHPNIVTVREIVVGSNMDKIFIVMDYVEHDLKSLMETMKHKKQGFLPGEVKCLVQQLLKAVAHLHDNWILHRDLKTSNLLLSHKGILKVGDFGLAREYGSPLRAYTPVVVTLWYRSPELLLGCREYSTAIDMWSVGCIFAELLAMSALFPGKSEVDQLNRIFKDLGTPNEKIWPGYTSLPAVQKMTFSEYPVSSLSRRFGTLTPRGLNLLNGFLTYDPGQRISADDALKHSYFKEVPLPIDPAMFPTWPAKSELGTRRALASSPKPPSGGDQFKALGQGDGADDAIGFHWGGTQGMTLLESRNIAMGAGFSLKF